MTTAKDVQVPRCPIRGHDHHLHLHRTVSNMDNQQAYIWECPGGVYRWFQLATNAFSDTLRMKRPRWGWRNDV